MEGMKIIIIFCGADRKSITFRSWLNGLFMAYTMFVDNRQYLWHKRKCIHENSAMNQFHFILLAGG